jgi:hypothetical protein
MRCCGASTRPAFRRSTKNAGARHPGLRSIQRVRYERAAARRTTKAPPGGAFARCAEEDSNLHPVIPDQALNLVTQVSYPSESRQIVRIVRFGGRYGHIGRSGCCHGCCHGRLGRFRGDRGRTPAASNPAPTAPAASAVACHQTKLRWSSFQNRRCWPTFRPALTAGRSLGTEAVQ